MTTFLINQQSPEKPLDLKIEFSGLDSISIQTKSSVRSCLRRESKSVWKMAGKNIKACWMRSSLAVGIGLGAMYASCAVSSSSEIKVASMVVFPLASALMMKRCEMAVQKEKQVRRECNDIICRLQKDKTFPPFLFDFKKEYPLFVKRYQKSDLERKKQLRRNNLLQQRIREV